APSALEPLPVRCEGAWADRFHPDGRISRRSCGFPAPVETGVGWPAIAHACCAAGPALRLLVPGARLATAVSRLVLPGRWPGLQPVWRLRVRPRQTETSAPQ